MAVTLDFLEGNILNISQLDLIRPNFSLVSGLEFIAKYLRVILTPNLGLHDEQFLKLWTLEGKKTCFEKITIWPKTGVGATKAAIFNGP